MKGYGVDGCKDGWFFVGLGSGGHEFGVIRKIEELLERIDTRSSVIIDIPIGLPWSGLRERSCDREARRKLSPHRHSSVFPVPSRAAVYARDYPEANELNRRHLDKGLPKQSWAIAPKIREVDELLRQRPEFRGRLRECHPEVCFWGLAGEPMRHSKKSQDGIEERIALLAQHIPDVSDLSSAAFFGHEKLEVQRDDIVDAMVDAVCAVHIDRSVALGNVSEVDEEGLPMEMVYWTPIVS